MESTKRRTWNGLLSSPSLLNVLYFPALALFGVFILYPFLKGLQISFTNWDGYSQSSKWIGVSNYTRIFQDPDIVRVIRNTFIYGLGSTLFQNILGLAYALLLNQRLRFKGLTRTIVYLPAIISPLIMGYIWYFFFQYRGGAINDIILLFTDQPVNLLGNSNWNVWMITLVNTYQFVGVAMVIFLAGLQTISKDYYEAAIMDGAGRWFKFSHVTWPLLAPSLTISIVLNVIGGLKLFDVITALTNSGPGYASASLSTLMYKLYFGRQDAGYAASIGIVMFLIISVVSISILIVLRRREVSAA
ncbi:carbohydrate ABC transporter permease [Paenibacillus sedimenti]|uniref:Sugar ABC transporter permease n=1 Tax=Paenibacillus sedimenti TaxID=2770274 RepID=A0A926QL69_9BACL|nr:sugar ABC transporter permease [Paenibacillus sedimenti]MBD0382543.1 sugar ABC transporter permease [Paenibacillus sedimenti]